MYVCMHIRGLVLNEMFIVTMPVDDDDAWSVGGSVRGSRHDATLLEVSALEMEKTHPTMNQELFVITLLLGRC